jgi:hypothetical protein
MKIIRNLRGTTPRRRALIVEHLEPRFALSAGLRFGGGHLASAHSGSRIGGSAASASATSSASGVDSLALGDVNADQLVDLIVAGHSASGQTVTIYDGHGQPGPKGSRTSVTNVIGALPTDPLGAGVGPLVVAAGDFAGLGVSQVAVASSSGSANVATWQFSLATPGGSPLDAPVTATSQSAPFVAPGLEGATGMSLAAADFARNGVDELVVAPAGGDAHIMDLLLYQPSAGTWQLVQQIDLDQAGLKGGVNVSAGDLFGTGSPVIAVGSQTDGQVAIYDPATQAWQKVT